MSEVIMKKPLQKEELLKFSDLNSEKIEQLTDDQMEAFTETLTIAVTIFPVQKEKLESAYAEKDYAQTMRWLKATRNNFSTIHADGFANSCEKCLNQSKDLTTIRHDRLGIFLEYLLGTATVFFGEIQTMLEKLEMPDEEFELEDEDTMERYRKKLLSVSDLNSEKILMLEACALNNYFELLEDFLNGLAAQEVGLRSSLKITNYSSVIKWMSVVAESLALIHADDLFEECSEKLQLYGDLTNVHHEKLDIFVNYFLTNLKMLAEDIEELNLPKKEEESCDEDAPPNAVIDLSDNIVSFKKILLVNDTRIFFENLRISLEGTGYKLVGTPSADAAIDYLKGVTPGLIIVDDDMPQLDGQNLVRKIRGIGHTVPIIFLTSNITKDYMVTAITAGVADFIIKPISTVRIREKIAKYLEQTEV